MGQCLGKAPGADPGQSPGKQGGQHTSPGAGAQATSERLSDGTGDGSGDGLGGLEGEGGLDDLVDGALSTTHSHCWTGSASTRRVADRTVSATLQQGELAEN